MYYTVYKVTNKMNGKFYIGTHKTKNLDDDYYGSGKRLRYAINKYGLENFEKQILFIFDNPDEMFAKEAEIVNEDFLAEENTYNLKVGGFGGWDYINENITAKQKSSLQGGKSTKEKYGTKWAKERGKMGSKVLRKKYPEGVFKNKQHTDETKQKIGEANSIKQNGSKNSQYGTRWIHSLEEQRNRKIKKTEPIPDGWLSGRKLKF